MLGLLVFLPLLLGVAILHFSERCSDWREAVVLASIAWAGSILIATELLSAIHLFSFAPAALGWTTTNVALGFGLWRRRRQFVLPRLSLAGSLFAIPPTIALVIALASPPNTPDALSYHLPRQAMWLQQGGLQHFLTVNDRALMMPPLAEIIQAHALLLSGSDAWANCPQWLAYVIGMILVSLITAELGGTRLAQAGSALIFATLPMAWHEATSAKNDLLVAVWLAMFALFALRLIRTRGAGMRDWLCAGTALGLALATKTTALLFCLPLLPLLLRAILSRPVGMLRMALPCVLLIAPHATRNIEWYGTPVGIHRAADGGGHEISPPSVHATLSTLLRNFTLHLATPSPTANAAIATAVNAFHRLIGADPNDRSTTLWILQYGVAWGPRDEMIAGAPMHFLLGFAALILLVTRRKPLASMWPLAITVVGSAIVYCSVLKWQPAGARLHLPVFTLLAPLIALVAQHVGRSALVVAMAFCVLGWLPSFETSDRPIMTEPRLWNVDRWQNYFRFYPPEQAAQEACLEALRAHKITSLQIVSRHGFPWPLMQRWQKESPDRSFWGVLPDSEKRSPDAVLVLDRMEHPAIIYPSNARTPYVRSFLAGPYALFVPRK